MIIGVAWVLLEIVDSDDEDEGEGEVLPSVVSSKLPFELLLDDSRFAFTESFSLLEDKNFQSPRVEFEL